MNRFINFITDTKYFKWLFLLNSLLYSFFLYTPKMGKYTTAFFTLWAAIIILVKLIKKEFDFKRKNLWCLCLFLLVFALSAAVNFRLAFVDNIKSLIVTAIFFVLAYYFEDKNPEARKKEFSVCMGIVFVYTFIVSLASVIFYFLNITFAIYFDRYCGVYSSPILSGLMSCCGAFACVYFMLSFNKRKLITKILLIFGLILQFMITAISSSRSAFACMVVFLSVFFISAVVRKTGFKIPLKAVASVLGAALIFFGVKLAYSGTQTGMAKLNLYISEHAPSLTSPTVIEQIGSYKFDTYSFERTNTGASNSIRVNLLKTGFEIFKDKPILGTSPRYIRTAAQEIAKETNLNITGIVGGGLHNSYMEILSGLGIAGLAVIVLFMVLFLKTVFKAFIKLRDNKKEFFTLSVIFAAAAAFAVVFMFESVMMFAVAAPTVFFWVILGRAAGISEEILQKEDK